MARKRLGLLGLCALLFGLMAFNTSAAQAEVGAKWLLAKADGTLVNFLEATVGLETDAPFVQHSEIAKIQVLLLCTTITVINAVLKANGSIGEGAKLKFSGCTLDLNGATSKPCEPNNEGKEPGVILTKPAHGLLILHKLASGVVDDLVSILPDNVGGVPSEVYSTLEMGKECAIGTKINLIGKVAFKDGEGLSLAHLVKHLIEAGGWGTELTELWTISKTNEHKAIPLGSVWATLTGPHTGMKFGGDPA